MSAAHGPGVVAAVRVFLDRALITRRTRLPDARSAREVDFSPLPLDIDPTSFRARASTESGGDRRQVRITGVSTSLILGEDAGRHDDPGAILLDIDEELAVLDDEDSIESHAGSARPPRPRSNGRPRARAHRHQDARKRNQADRRRRTSIRVLGTDTDVEQLTDKDRGR